MAKFSYLSSIAQKKAASRAAPCELAEGELYNLYRINRFPDDVKRRLYACLIPDGIFTRFHLNRDTLCDDSGRSIFTIHCQPRSSIVRLEVRHQYAFPDPVFLLEMRDNSFHDLEILFFNLNNPYAERFNIDRDADGNDTAYGMISHNISEEVRAMQAGLAPGQIRQGLRMFHDFLNHAREFCRQLGIVRVKIEPMAYHNAILHEFYGFRYIRGREMMQRIDREFAPGGTLYQRLDGSTPFRQPGFERSIKGRSWAIHDGILGEVWTCPRMYYTIDQNPGRVYDEFTCHTFRHCNSLLNL
ncbi:hypothetical protein CSB45_09435 [candidate division KSB3 bacterium]|uniref:Uncharacterized protein n=1 Tax=candidate division KSB3 bacterium TaxID=2044937 RepID=A0A2G6E518_9BACT|nr:MAG: hypothetical protein CSB45_09435 [candidate division KSB3 bacterium]PIE29453.1 MAG: hypothetical protein CSA57_08640 [candidate division KSB3 bacterium]